MMGRKTTAWDVASDGEQVMVLRRLFHEHPELQAEADQLVSATGSTAAVSGSRYRLHTWPIV